MKAKLPKMYGSKTIVFWHCNFLHLYRPNDGLLYPEGGFIYSFNGPHSLFVDTVRTIRILVAGHLLGHHSSGENDIKINLLKRAYQHALATAKYSVYYAEGRDSYDIWGRTAHEAIFNTNDGKLPLPFNTTRLQRFLDLDPWFKLGHVRFCRAT